MPDWSITDSDPLFEKFDWVEDSVIYEAAFRQGREKGRREGASIVRAVVMEVGQQRFGKPSLPIQIELEGIWSLPLLQQLAYRLSEASSWEELMTVQYDWRPFEFHKKQGYRDSIIRIMAKRFGEISDANRERLQSIHSETELVALIDRFDEVNGWDELLNLGSG